MLPEALNLLRIQGYAKPEGVIIVPLKMEHVRERVHVSQAFKVLSQTPGIGIVFLKHSRFFPKPLGLGYDLCLIFFQEKFEEKKE